MLKGGNIEAVKKHLESIIEFHVSLQNLVKDMVHIIEIQHGQLSRIRFELDQLWEEISITDEEKAKKYVHRQ